MRLALLVVLALLTGCASTFEHEPTTYMDEIPVRDVIDVTAADYPQPVLVVRKVDGVEYATLDAEQVEKLRSFKAAAITNQELVTALNDVVSALVIERNSILEVGKIQESRANDMEHNYLQVTHALRKKERLNFIEVTAYRVIIAALLFGM